MPSPGWRSAARAGRAAGLACAALVAAARAEPARLADVRLTGIVIAGEERVAVFADRPGEPWLVLREGDRLGDERVAAIAAAAVRLDGPAGSRTVSLRDDPAARAALMAAIPPSGPYIDPYRRERETENDQ